MDIASQATALRQIKPSCRRFVRRQELNQAGFGAFLRSNRRVNPIALILRCPAQPGLEGRSSARHPSFEAPLRIHIGCSRCGPLAAQHGNTRVGGLRMRSRKWHSLYIWILAWPGCLWT